ncbi:MAG: hypothetical protein BGO29_00955 [Bacteroidales bacterium 36-12]|nr:MAG: hypothetical protein BGO29_00955 [Bacteroidales bacterium 36-12]
MFYFILLIVLTILSGCLYKGRIISKKTACIIISISAIIIYGIRSANVGNIDIPRYVYIFDSFKYLRFKDVATQYTKDLGFYYFSKFISTIFHNYNLWLTAIGTLFILSVSTLIVKFSKDIIISYFIFFTFFFAINFSLLRHCTALSFVVLGYVAIKDKKTQQGLFFLILASLFHLSSIISMFLFLLKKIKFGKWNFVMMLLTVFISRLIPDLLSKIVLLINMDRLSHYASSEVMRLTNSAFIIHFTLFLIILLLIRIKDKRILQKYSFELNMYTVGISFYALVGVLAEFLRTAMFFSFILIVLLPNILNDNLKSKNSPFFLLGGVIFIVMLLIYFFSTVLIDAELLPYETIFTN